MIFVVNNLPQRDARILHDAHVFAEIHQIDRAARQASDDALHRRIECVSNLPVALRFLKALGLCLPNRGVACHYQREQQRHQFTRVPSVRA